MCVLGSVYTTENSDATLFGITVGWAIVVFNPDSVAHFLAQARQEKNSLEEWLRESWVNKRENYKVIPIKCLS